MEPIESTYGPLNV